MPDLPPSARFLGPAHSLGPAPEPDWFFSLEDPVRAASVSGSVCAVRRAMAAGGSDPRAGDVEEDASQLIFPKGSIRDSSTLR